MREIPDLPSVAPYVSILARRIQMKAEQFLKGKPTLTGGTQCMIGGEIISATTTGRQKYLDGYACDDHYFAKLGGEVERRPVQSPTHCA